MGFSGCRNCEPTFTMMSLHMNTHFAKKRGIAKNVFFAVRAVLCQEQIEMVAAWRKKSGDDQQRDNTIEGALANKILPIPHGPTPLWGPGGVPGEWTDECGFTKSPNTDNEWQIRGHGAFEIISAFDPLTKAAITRCGSTFHTPTLGRQSIRPQLTIHVALEKKVIHMTTRDPTRPSAQENASVHGNA